MPEKTWAKIKAKIQSQWRICFLTALVLGLAAHFYKITNWLPNWDSLVFRYDGQNMLRLGRWFLSVACAASTFYDLPWIGGLLAIVFHGLGAVCVCRIFDVKKNMTAVLIGGMIATFPTVTSVMMYNYVADGYGLSFFLATLAALCMTKEKPNFVAGGLMIMLSVAIYQAYITVTILLLLCWLIREAIRKETTVQQLLMKSLGFLLTGIAGMLLYYLVLTVLLKVTGTELLTYQGIENTAAMASIDLVKSFYVIKESFLNYFFDFSQGIRLFPVINCLVGIVTVGLYLADIIKNRTSFGKLILLFAFLVLMPIGASVLALLNGDIDYHNLMKMGFFVFYLFLILQYEKADFSKEKLNAAKLWSIFGICVVLVFYQVLIANVCYHKLQIAYEKSYGTLIRIADRIEQTEGAEDCDRILVLGGLPGSEAYSVDLLPNMTGATDSYIIKADDESVEQSVLCSALNDYCGKNYSFIAGAEKEALLQKIDKKALAIWPEKDAVFLLDQVIVISLGNEG